MNRMKADHERVKALLAESITVLCKNGLQYKTKFTIQGLLGITLDDDDVFLVDIHEKVGEPMVPDVSDKQLERRSPGAKSKRSGRSSPRSKKRRKSGSDTDRSRSPDIELSGSESASQDNQILTHSGFGDRSFEIESGISGSKESTTVTSGDQCALDMGVEHILELAKDIPPLTENNDNGQEANRLESELESSEFRNTSRTQRETVSEKIVVKNENDDIVFVKQEKSESSSHAGASNVHSAAETVTRGTYLDSPSDTLSEFSAHGPFRHAQPLSSPPHITFSQGPSTSQSDSFQAGEQLDTSADLSTEGQGHLRRKGKHYTGFRNPRGAWTGGKGLRDGDRKRNYPAETDSSMASGSTINDNIQMSPNFRMDNQGWEAVNLICVHCNKSFATASQLKRHVKCHSMLHTCNICGKFFSYEHNMKKHMVIHTGLKPYTCQTCGKAFNDPSNYKRHCKSHRTSYPT